MCGRGDNGVQSLWIMAVGLGRLHGLYINYRQNFGLQKVNMHASIDAHYGP